MKECTSFIVKELSPSEVNPGNDIYMRKVDRSSNCYKDYDGIVSVCDENLRLIDGYHRYSCCKNKETIKIICICSEKLGDS